MTAPAAPLYDAIGAEGLRAMIAEFYRRVFDDVMIGFMFAGKDQRRLIDKECELAARMLGASIPYTGKPLRAAHAPHKIFGGQFDRRLQILRDAMAAHDVDLEVRRVLIEHSIAMRAQITADPGSDCGVGGDVVDRTAKVDERAAKLPLAPAPSGLIGLRRRERR